MKHRDRVLMALNMEEPDRCPMQISFTPEFANRLKAEMKINNSGEHNPHGGGNTYDLERIIDEDILITSVGWANSYYLDSKPYTDEWGIGWETCQYETPFGKGYYTDVTRNPLADDAAIASYIPPDPLRPELYFDAENTIKNHKDEYYIIGATVTTIFETAWALRGLKQSLMDFLINPELTNAIFDIPFNYHLTAAKKLVEIGVDMIWLGDDVGSKNGMMIDPEIWRLYLKPRMAQFISELKVINPNVKVAYHSDGNIMDIIPELIEIGLDVLNPIQPASMDPAELKKKFGDKLCFWGSIDEQYTLPFGTATDVKNEVMKRLMTIGKGGGFIIGPTHSIQLDTPMENYHAMVDTIRNTKYSSLCIRL